MAEIFHSVPILAERSLSSLPWLNNYIQQKICSVHDLFSMGSYQHVFKHGALVYTFTQKNIFTEFSVSLPADSLGTWILG